MRIVQISPKRYIIAEEDNSTYSSAKIGDFNILKTITKPTDFITISKVFIELKTLETQDYSPTTRELLL